MSSKWAQPLLRQLLNSLVVGGIVALSTLGDWTTVGKAAGLAFLIEFRNYLEIWRKEAS